MSGLLLLLAPAATQTISPSGLASTEAHGTPTATQTVALVQSKTAVGAGANSIAATWDAPTTAGNLLLAVIGLSLVGSPSNNTITPPSGWTLVQSVESATNNKTFLYKIENASSRSGSESFSWGATNDAVLMLLEYDGTVTTGVEDRNANNVGSSTTADSGTTAATTVANEYAIAVLSNRNNSTQSSPTNGFTQLAQLQSTNGTAGNRVNTGIYVRNLTATGTVNASATISSSRPWTGVVATFKVAVGVESQTISPTGLASGEAHGSHTITPGSVQVSPGGLPGTEAHGTPAITSTIAPSGLATGEAHGTATITSRIAPSGLASAEAQGTATITSVATISPSGLATGEAHGAHSVSPGAVSTSPAGLASAEAHGSATVALGPVTLSPAGTGSGEAHGNATLTTGPVTLGVAGQPSSEAHGAAVIASVVTPGGVASGEGHGTPGVTTVAQVAGQPSSEAHGTATIHQRVNGSGLASGEAHGTTTIVPGSTTINPSGLASGESHGVADLTGASLIVAGNLASGEAHGAATITSTATISPAGTGTGEAHGSVAINSVANVTMNGLASQEAHGSTVVTPGVVIIQPAGQGTAEGHGGAATAPGAVTISPVGLPSQVGHGHPLVGSGPNIVVVATLVEQPTGRAVLAPQPATDRAVLESQPVRALLEAQDG